MTKEPIWEAFCAYCRRIVYGKAEKCPVCGSKLIQEAK